MLSELHDYLHERFKEVFGKPSNTLGRDDHWALRPSPSGHLINVLVDGTPAQPAVWVFDPHDRDQGVIRTIIQNEDQVEQIISIIQEHLENAGRKLGSHEGSRSPRKDQP